MKKLIILNGPPGAGKDTVADIIVKLGICKDKVSFKSPMFNVAKSMLSSDEFDGFIKNYDDREYKESPHEFLGGMTVRQFMIWISESVMKPVFGDEVFGKRLAQSLGNGCHICSDGGFASEIEPLIESGVEVTLVRLHRPGYTFEGDSRSYISGLCAREIDIDVIEGDIKITTEKVIDAINSTNR
ncbi:ATPase [Escherichia phage TR1]|nr:ATPase [Escherichia phage TR1]WDS61356.1 hypothetical protein CY1_00023 [Escherichia phage CY1_Cui-2023]